MNNLEYINGDLQLENAAFENFKSFQGLNKLTSIKGGLILRHDGLSSNHTFFNKLSSFAGLNNLETIGGISFCKVLMLEILDLILMSLIL